MSAAITQETQDIMRALSVLGRHGREALKDNPDFLRAITPLINAISAGDHNAIVGALWKRTLTDHEKERMILHNTVHLIVTNPKSYGVESLTKTDVLEILRVKYPEFDRLLPTSPRGRSEFWKEVGIEVKQGRGAISPGLRLKLKEADPERHH